MALATEAAATVAAKVVTAVEAKVASAVVMAPAAMERVVVVVRLSQVAAAVRAIAAGKVTSKAAVEVEATARAREASASH